MRVATWYSNRDVRVEERPVPAIGPDEVLMRVEACGICGSDVMEWYRLDRAPLVLGHELAGVVEDVGKGVAGFRPGDRVTVAHHVPCNTCHYCLGGHHTACDTLRKTNIDPGGFAEFARIPAINVDRGLFKLPDEVAFDDATFVEPLACVMRAQRQARIEPGNSVLVLGSGVAGLMHILTARLTGAGRILATDVSPFRLDAAKRYGADAAIQATECMAELVRELNGGKLPDRVIVCTGAMPAMMQSLECIDRGGTVLFFAPTDPGATVPLSINDLFWRNDITLTTSYAGSPADYAAALEFVRVHRNTLRSMVTHRFGLGQTGDGFRLVAGGGESIKVIVEPQR